MTAQGMARIYAQAFPGRAAWTAKTFEDYLNNPQALVSLGDDGFLIATTIADELEVITIAVDPQAQGQGTGTRLMQDAFAKAQTKGCTTAFLEVATNNAAALALYANFNFVEVGRRKNYYAKPGQPAVDALILRAAIPLQSA